jgi:hypothetical protein
LEQAQNIRQGSHLLRLQVSGPWKLGSVAEKHKAHGQFISIFIEESIAPDSYVGVEQVYVLSGMNKCLI